MDKGFYFSDLVLVVKNYAQRGLFIDILASCPISWVEYYMTFDVNCDEKTVDVPV